jgi:hypothetical protein
MQQQGVNITCDANYGCYTTDLSPCPNLNQTNFLTSYAFNLWSQEEQAYSIVVPLGTFASEYYNSEFYSTPICLIRVQETTADFTTFGSDLFAQFYGQFTNDYAKEELTVSLYSNYDARFSAVGAGPY